MAWNPDTYNKFKTERFAPFEDLISLIKVKPALQVIDLGCGTGELTAKLASVLPAPIILGIDSSKEMLSKANSFTSEQVSFANQTIEDTIATGKKWDLIFSNAALQWTGNHATLVPQLVSLVTPGGQLAVQVPSNHGHLTHVLLRELASTEPYKTALNGWVRVSPVLPIEAYAGIFFTCNCTDITVYEKAYLHVLENANALYEWMAGTAMIPYIEKLSAGMQQQFIHDYKNELLKNYTASPVVYPFKRILMAATGG
jgi:trans-aconitate 2-methyltransferase